jgi:endonuclease/exonuclease/phosphatase family protein
MRIATYNVEWFSALFSRNDKLLMDDKRSARYKITRAEQIKAIAKVLTAVDADAMLIVEAPNTSKRQSSARALEGFAQTFKLRSSRALEGFATDTRQEITLLYDPDTCQVRHDPIGGPPNRRNPADAPRFDTSFLYDLDDDTKPESVTFSKPPLEVAFTPKGGRPVRLIGVHVKSKAPHGAKSVEDMVKLSIENRRKQLAQCRWLRRRIDSHLDKGDAVIVLGDMNDGPGLDEYELLFGQSSVEVVMGLENNDDRMLYDPNVAEALALRGGNPPATSRFYIKPRRAYLNALLDYIMVSPDLRDAARGWKIWHPFDNPDCYNDVDLREALLTASDHFPVTLDIDL